MSNLEQVKKLREETGVSLMECKKAIEESGGDIESAKEILKKRGQEMAAKKAGREAGEGMIDTYIHPNGRIGVLLDLRCESDFVAKSEDFKNLSKEICLQIAAMSPEFIKEEDIPGEVLEKEKSIYREQFKESGKPEDVVEKILEGKIKNHISETCLLSQSWIKDEKKTIGSLVEEMIAKLGENIVVKRFTRYEI